MSSEGILLFTNDGGGGSASSLFDQTSFQDTQLPASNNSGLTSTVGTNPLNEYFANDLAPKWMSKTLWIKDLVRVTDKSLWINGKPTFKVVWNENFPGADGYAFGDVISTATGEVKYLTLSGNGDGFGVSGVIRRVQWIFRPTKVSSATVTQLVDGVSTGSVSLPFLAAGDNQNTYPEKTMLGAVVHGATNETHDLHDYRVTADQFNAAQIEGVVVYFNIDGSGIECFTGTGYLNKSQVSPVGSSLAFPTGASSFLGGAAAVQYSAQGSFGLTSVLIPSTSSIAIGTINTNLLSLSTGTGASFPIGSAVYIPNGSTYYIGQVTNVSSDVITVGPTLPFGISNTISQIMKVGSSFVIGTSLYAQAMDYQPSVQNRGIGASMLPSPDSAIYQSSPYLDWRAWGFTHQFVYGSSLCAGFSTLGNALSGITIGLVSRGVSSFLQIDGRFSALEAEWMVGISSSLSASFVIDGFVNSSLSEGASLSQGLIRRVLFTDAGVGWHSVRMNWGGSTQVALTRVIGYRPSVSSSVTLGVLAEAPIPQDFVVRTSAVGSTNVQNGLTTMAWGNVRRIYADNLSRGASWSFVSGQDAAYAPGGVALHTNTVGRTISFQYFGTRYSIVGNPGATVGITVDGAPDAAGSTFNTWLGTGLTLGFHTVSITAQASGFTTVVGAIDFLSPVDEMLNKQSFTANAGYSNLIRSYYQSAAPISPKMGDIWQSSETPATAFQYMYGGWQPMFSNVPGCAYGASNSQKIIPGGATNLIIWDYQTYDPFGMGSAGATMFNIKVDGTYLIAAQVRYVESGASFGSNRSLYFSVNGSQSERYMATAIGVSSTNGLLLSGTAVVPNLKKGNTVAFNFFSFGVTLSTAGGPDGTLLSIQRIGP